MCLEVGTWIEGRYRILRSLGSGSEGTVYLAYHQQTARFYAIKELDKQGICFSPEGVALWKRLNCPGIPEIADVLEGETTLLIVMEYIEGKTLRAWLQQYGSPGVLRLVDWSIEICRTLEYLHSQNPPVIYGDLKPENIILQKGRPVLTDLGSAVLRGSRGKRTGTGGLALEYDPERQDGRGQQEDLYSFGMLLKELLKDQKPAACRKLWKLAEALTENAVRQTEKDSCTGDLRSRRKPALHQLFGSNLNREWNPVRFKNRKKAGGFDKTGIRNIRQCRRELERFRRKPLIWKRALLLAGVLVCLAGIRCGGEMLCRQQTSLYGEILREAQQDSGAARTEKLEAAIRLCPERADAYLELLQGFLEDLTFDQDEELRFRRILKEVPEGTNRTCEFLLKENLSAYLEVAWKTGTAYWYFFEGREGKSRAADWFAKVCAVPEALPENQDILNRSKIYAQLGACRQELEQYAVTGEDVSIFADYWSQMQQLALQEQNETSDAAVRLRFWQEFLAELLHYTAEFAEAGITKEEMEDMLQKMSTELGQMESEREQIQTLREELLQSADEMEDRIRRTYRDE